MKVRSRWMDEMPMIAMASLIFSTLALTWLEPFRLIRMAFEPEARDEGLVAADDDHDQQVGDHDHVDQAQHDQHDLLFAEGSRMADRGATVPSGTAAHRRTWATIRPRYSGSCSQRELKIRAAMVLRRMGIAGDA